MDFLYISLWIGSIVVCYLVAEKKGRDTGWAVIALVFGPIAAIVLLCLPSLTPEEAAPSSTSSKVPSIPKSLQNLEELEKLGQLKEKGVLNDEEFLKMKADVIKRAG